MNHTFDFCLGSRPGGADGDGFLTGAIVVGKVQNIGWSSGAEADLLHVVGVGEESPTATHHKEKHAVTAIRRWQLHRIK